MKGTQIYDNWKLAAPCPVCGVDESNCTCQEEPEHDEETNPNETAGHAMTLAELHERCLERFPDRTFAIELEAWHYTHQHTEPRDEVAWRPAVFQPAAVGNDIAHTFRGNSPDAIWAKIEGLKLDSMTIDEASAAVEITP